MEPKKKRAGAALSSVRTALLLVEATEKAAIIAAKIAIETEPPENVAARMT